MAESVTKPAKATSVDPRKHASSGRKDGRPEADHPVPEADEDAPPETPLPENIADEEPKGHPHSDRFRTETSGDDGDKPSGKPSK